MSLHKGATQLWISNGIATTAQPIIIFIREDCSTATEIELSYILPLKVLLRAQSSLRTIATCYFSAPRSDRLQNGPLLLEH